MQYICIVKLEKRSFMIKQSVFFFLSLLFITIPIFAETGKQYTVPFEFGASYVGESMHLLHGGLHKGSTYEGMANISFSFLTEKAGWWKGGSFLITGANTHGGTPSSDFIGDFQVASNIEAGDLTYLHECWYRQEVGDWTFIVGLQDLNSEFVYTESANLFLNSSFGTHSTIASNVPSPIFPLTSLGAHFQYAFSSKLTAKLAVFDGMPEDLDYNPHNISWHLNSNDGYLAFAELDVADFKFGSYYHNHSPYSDGADTTVPNYGMYLTADKTFFRSASGRMLNAFAQFSISPASKNNNNWYLGGGIHCTGLFLRRTKDEFGLAFAHAALQHSANGSETTLEMTYKLKVCEQVFLQPDMQFILNPAGTDGTLENALALFLRFGLEF
jgi:porin